MTHLVSTRSFCRNCLLLFTVLFISFYQQDFLYAGHAVSGRYLSAGGKSVVLNLNVQNPSPSNLIVEQYLNPGNKIVSTSPRAKKIDNHHCKVKWLLKNIRSGNVTLSITLQAPLKGQPNAMIRYRDPKGGAFTELNISP